MTIAGHSMTPCVLARLTGSKHRLKHCSQEAKLPVPHWHACLTAGCTSSCCIAHHIVLLSLSIYICSATAPEVQAVADAAVCRQGRQALPRTPRGTNLGNCKFEHLQPCHTCLMVSFSYSKNGQPPCSKPTVCNHGATMVSSCQWYL
jgi:hypothetical protein